MLLLALTAVIHLYAALQMCFTQCFYDCQGDLNLFCFALVHQCVRDRTDEAHVEETEAEVLTTSIVSIERWRFAKPLRSLSKSASRGSVIVKPHWFLEDVQFQRTSSATMHDCEMTV